MYAVRVRRVSYETIMTIMTSISCVTYTEVGDPDQVELHFVPGQQPIALRLQANPPFLLCRQLQEELWRLPLAIFLH